MKNKKGFTLIELLAVIIILGILMLIAIPSVTTYINNSRRNTYAETAANYVKAAIPKVNEGRDFQFYEEKTLFLIPAGNDKGKSCISLESGGGSPYNKDYEYNYVGVTYNNSKGSFTYYFIAKDQSGNGFEFSTYEGLTAKDAKELVKNVDTIEILKNTYTGSGSPKYLYTDDCESGDSTCAPLSSLVNDTDGIEWPQGMPTIEKIVVVQATGCKYSSSN